MTALLISLIEGKPRQAIAMVSLVKSALDPPIPEITFYCDSFAMASCKSAFSYPEQGAASDVLMEGPGQLAVGSGEAR